MRTTTATFLCENASVAASPQTAARIPQGLLQNLFQLGQTLLHAFHQVQTHHRFLVTLQRFEIAHGQRELQLSERVTRARNRNVFSRFAGENHEKPLRRASLKYLAEMVQVTRAETQQCRYPQARAQLLADARQNLSQRRAALQERQRSHVPLRIFRFEKRPQSLRKTQRRNLMPRLSLGIKLDARFANSHRPRGQPALGRQPLDNLRHHARPFAQVRLVERVHLQQRASQRRRHFPFEHFRAQFFRRAQFDRDARHSCFLQLLRRFRDSRIFITAQPENRRNAAVLVALQSGRNPHRNRNQPTAALARAHAHQLRHAVRQRRKTRRAEQQQPVASANRPRRQQRRQAQRRVRVPQVRAAAQLVHRSRGKQQRLGAEPAKPGKQQPKMNQRRISSADPRGIKENSAKSILNRQIRQVRILFRDRHKLSPGLVNSSYSQLLQKIQKQRVAFDLLSRFAGKNEKRSFMVQLPLHRSHRSRIGAVQHKNQFPAFG